MKNLDRALFTAFFVGVIVLLKEMFFKEMNPIISIIIVAIAAAIGYLLGDTLLDRKKHRNN